MPSRSASRSNLSNVRVHHVKLMAEYGNTMLWHDGGEVVGPIELEAVPLADSTRQRLAAWGRYYDGTLDPDDPRQGGFESWTKICQFDRVGKKLWERLRRELGPTYRVTFFSQKDGETYQPPA